MYCPKRAMGDPLEYSIIQELKTGLVWKKKKISSYFCYSRTLQLLILSIIYEAIYFSASRRMFLYFVPLNNSAACCDRCPQWEHIATLVCDLAYAHTKTRWDSPLWPVGILLPLFIAVHASHDRKRWVTDLPDLVLFWSGTSFFPTFDNIRFPIIIGVCVQFPPHLFTLVVIMCKKSN